MSFPATDLTDPPQSGAPLLVNEAHKALIAASLYGKKAQTSSGLTYGYHGGRYNGVTVADGTVSLTGSATNYIVAARSGGAVSASTGTTNWNDSTNYVRLHVVVTNSTGPTSETDYRMDTGGLFNAGSVTIPKVVQVAVSDQSSALTTGTAKITFRMPYAMTLSAVRASLSTAQTSGSILTVDVNEGGSTILSTKLTIDNGEKTSATAATPPVISDTALADDAEITIDIDQVGDGTAKGLIVTLIGT